MLAIWILKCLPGIFLKGLNNPSSTLKLMRVSTLVGKTPSIFSMRVNIWIADSYLPKLSWWLVFVLWESSSDNLPCCWIGYEQVTKTNHSTYLLFHCKAYTPICYSNEPIRLYAWMSEEDRINGSQIGCNLLRTGVYWDDNPLIRSPLIHPLPGLTLPDLHQPLA